MSQSRYITFSGDPAGKPLRYTFHRAADFRAMGLAGVASYLVNSAFPAPPVKVGEDTVTVSPETAGIGTLLMNAFWIGIARWVEKSSLNRAGLNSETKCIDTDPDHSTPPNSADDLRKAQAMKRYYLMMGGIILGLTAMRATSDLATRGAITDVFNNLASKASFFTWAYRGYQRYNRVLSGEWRITNMPTSERLTELERGNAPEQQALPDPSPA